MSRRISEDFDAFNDFLSKYSLTSYTRESKQIEPYKGMHKNLFGLLVFSAEFKLQGQYPALDPFLNEMGSDLLLALFSIVQGMYKPAKLLLRCSMENFLKSMVMIDTPTIIQERSVYEIFDAAKNDRHFAGIIGQACIGLLHDDYVKLCQIVHGDPAVMNPTSSLSMLPKYDSTLEKEALSIYMRTLESYLEILYFNFPITVDKMHPENKEDFLDCLAKRTKHAVIDALYSI